MSSRGTIVALEGPSGSGKSTLAARLASDFGWVLLAEAVDRLEPPVSLHFSGSKELFRLEERLLEEEARRFTTAAALAARGETVIADTGFVGPVTYTAGLVALGRCPFSTYQRILRAATVFTRRSTLGLPDLSVYLTVTPRTRARRSASDPVRHPVELRRRHEDAGRLEESVFRPWLSAQLPGRVRELSASAGPGALAVRTARLARGLRPLRDRTGRLHRVLLRWNEFAVETPSGQTSRAATLKKGTPPARAPAA